MILAGRSIAAAVFLAVVFSGTASGQVTRPQRDSLGPRRAELEQRFRQRTAEVVRRQLNLNSDQMARLQSVDRSFDSQRTALAERERDARRALREEMTAASPNQGKVSQLLEQMLRAQRQRLDLVESEQRELSKFLTPIQRARYLGLQNQMRRRMLELQQRPPGRQGMRPLPRRRPLR